MLAFEISGYESLGESAILNRFAGFRPKKLAVPLGRQTRVKHNMGTGDLRLPVLTCPTSIPVHHN